MPTTTIKQNHAFIVSGFKGLTTDGVHCSVEEKAATLSLSREEVLRALPVSTEVCATFSQHHGHFRKILTKLEREGLSFHVESNRGGITNVWRLS